MVLLTVNVHFLAFVHRDIYRILINMSYKFESKVIKALGKLLETERITMLSFTSERSHILRNFMRILYFYLVDPSILIKSFLLKMSKKRMGKYVITVRNQILLLRLLMLLSSII